MRIKLYFLFLILSVVFFLYTNPDSVFADAKCGEYHQQSYPYYTDKERVTDDESASLIWNYLEKVEWPSLDESKFCEAGILKPKWPDFPEAGEDTFWECESSNKTAKCFAHRALEPSRVPASSTCLNITGFCGSLHSRVFGSDKESWPSGEYGCAPANFLYYPVGAVVAPFNWGDRLTPDLYPGPGYGYAPGHNLHEDYDGWDWEEGVPQGFDEISPGWTELVRDRVFVSKNPYSFVEQKFDFDVQPPSFPDPGERVEWRCSRTWEWFARGYEVHTFEHRVTYIDCWAERRPPDKPVDPKCASPYHNETFSYEHVTWPSGTGLDLFCDAGDLVESSGYSFVANRPPFPSAGDDTKWRCRVGDEYADCSATREEPDPELDPELAYDIVRGFFVVDGEIDIKFVDEDEEVRDGLKVVGGLFATGGNESSIRLGRSLQLRDNLLYPTVVVFHDARYMDIARKVFGDTFGQGYVRDIGMKE